MTRGTRLAHALSVLSFYGLLSSVPEIISAATPGGPSLSFGHSSISYAGLPLSFEPTGDPAQPGFRAVGRGYRVSLLQGGLTLQLGPDHQASGFNEVRFEFLDVDPTAQMLPEGPVGTRAYYLEGQDLRSWRSNVPNYRRVRYQNLYSGIDLVFYGNPNRMEYDFLVAPGADPHQLRLAIIGGDTISIERGGDLALRTAKGKVLLQTPQAYQTIAGVRRKVAVKYRLAGRQIAFSVGQYDRSLPLVIDPVLEYASYVGRSVTDRVNAIAVNKDHSAYVAGLAPGATPAGHDEAFVAHLSADGTSLLSITYLGGDGPSEARGIALDSNGNIYIAGVTRASDFPALHALQPFCGHASAGKCSGDAFLAKLSPDGAPEFVTYLGGSGEDAANAIVTDSAGDIYITGSTTSADFPVSSAAQSGSAGGADAFVAKISHDGTRLIYSTYIGGSGEDAAFGIAVDASGRAVIAGQTRSTNFPTRSAFQSNCRLDASSQCPGQAFVARLSPEGSRLVSSTYLGGSGGDSATALALDSAGHIFVTGTTSSDDFPVLGSLQPKRRGGIDAFVSKFDSDGSTLRYSTFLGGSADDLASAIAVDNSGNALISGNTVSPDFPLQNAVQSKCTGKDGDCSQDAFLAMINASGSGLRFSTYLGGAGADQGRGVAVDEEGTAYIGGATTSSDFPKSKPVPRPRAKPGSPSGITVLAASAAAPADAEGPSGGAIVAVVRGIAATQSACSGSVNWTGAAGDGQWTTALNWDKNALPGTADNVCIGVNFSNTTITVGTISSAASQTIASLVSNASISFTTGPLTVNSGANFVNNLTLGGGTLTLNGASGSTVGGSLTQSGGTVGGTDTLTVSGLLTWSGGIQSGGGVTNANGGISIPCCNATLSNRVLNNAGAATFTSNQFVMANGATFNNTANGVWDDQVDAFIAYGSGTTPTFNNTGLFKKSGGTNTSGGGVSSSIAFVNAGTVTAGSGILSISAGGSCNPCAGAWNVSSGATLQLASATAITLSGPFSGTGTGTVVFPSGTLTVAGSSSAPYNVAGGTSVNGASVTFSGSVTTVGPVTLSSGNLTFSTGTTITVPTLTQSGGTLTGTDTLTVTALLTWSGGTETGGGITNANGGMSIPCCNATLSSRTLNNAGTATYTSNQFLMANGAILNNTATGVWDDQADSSIAYNTGSTPVVNNAGLFKKSAGTNSTGGGVAAGVTFNNTGTVAANSGILFIAGVGTCGSACAGSWTAGTGATLEVGSSSATSLSGSFTGTGTGAVAFPSGTLTVAGTYNVPGGTTVSGGSVTFTGTVTSIGPTSISSGSLTFSTGSTITAPSLTQSGGTLAGTDIVTVTGLLTWSGGTETGGGATNANGGMSIPCCNPTLNSRTLNNAGTATFSSNQFLLSNGAILNNTATGVWDDQVDAAVTANGGTTPVFNNAGSFKKSAGTNSNGGGVAAGVTFNNTGTVAANSGILALAGLGTCGGACGGSWAVGSGATLQLGSSTTTSLGGGFTGTGTGTVVFTSGTMTLSGTYNVPGGTGATGGNATFTGTITSAGDLNLSSGNLVFSTGKTVTVPTITQSGGTLAGTDTVAVTGLLTWSGGTQTGGGVTNANGGMAVPCCNATLSSRTLNNAGTATFTGNQFLMANGAVFNNTATGIWDDQADAAITSNGGATPVFNNAGIFKKSAGTNSNGGGVSSSVTFNNTGSVAANSGILSFAAVGGCGSACAGTWSVSTGSTLSLGAPAAATLSGSFTGAGTGLLAFPSGTLTLSGTYNVPGGTTVSGGSAAFTGTVANLGPVSLSSGTLTLSTGTAITISALAQSGGTLAGADTVSVTGALTWSGGTESGGGVTNANGGISIPCCNATLSNRTLNNAATATFTGNQFLMGNGAIFNNQPTGVWDDQVDAYISYAGGPTPIFSNAGTFKKSAGTNTNGGGVGSSITFNNTGTVAANSGILLIAGIGNCGTTCGGSWGVGTGATLELETGAATSLSGAFTGAGSGTVAFPSGTLTLTGSYNVPGGTSVTGGSATFSGAVANPGPITITNGNLTLSTGAAINTPSITQSGGTLTGTDTITVSGLMTWSGGTQTGGGITNANGGISMPCCNATLSNRTLNNAAGATFTSNQFVMSNGAIFNNLVTGTWDDQTDAFINSGGGTTPVVNNAGTFKKSAGTGANGGGIAGGISFNNSGTVAANSGNFNFSNFTQTGGNTVLAGGGMLLGSSMSIQGGTISGSGVISGNFSGNISTNPAGTIAPGNSATSAIGSLSFAGTGAGNYAQGTGALTVKIAGASSGQFDVVSAAGSAVLSGPLNVGFVGGFAPAAGNSFKILTAASVSGTFSTINVSNLPPNLQIQASYTGNAVTLTVGTGATRTITVFSGSGQNATVNTAFQNPLVALVTDANNNPVSGVLVTFTPPATGASGSFAGGVNTAVTNSAGQATSAVFSANGTTGTYIVPATVSGTSTAADFTLNNCDNRFLITRRCRQ